MKSTRRGFLRGSVGAAMATGACGRDASIRTAVPETAAPSPEPSDSVDVQARVNGAEVRLKVHPDDSALEVVRDELGLTGCKLACGHGACGACTLQLDGTPVASCLLPATALHERTVTTVEGIGDDRGDLHPVQRAFMAEDALQCGYCTPGFVVEAVAFVDRYRARYGTRTPERDEVAAALAGHLCRCGAYDDIVRAVQNACAGTYDAALKRWPRHDARAKVTGEARYTVDVRMHGLLHARALTSPHANARIARLETGGALRSPGVRGVVTLLEQGRRLRYAGQEILVVAALTQRQAEDALREVVIEYEVDPPLLDMQQARADGAPQIFPRRSERKVENASEGPLVPARWKGNVRGPFGLFSKAPHRARRTIEDARQRGDLVEHTFTTAVQCHTALEPHAAIARFGGDGELTVWTSTQAVTHLQRDIATRFGLPRDKVQVKAEYVGGGFGAKATLQTDVVVAVELARACGAAVRYVRDRRSELVLGGSRPGTTTRISASTDEDGTLAAVSSSTHSSSGLAVGHTVTPMMRLLYPNVPKALEEYDVITHAPPAKPFRGPGGPQAFWALEQTMDALAHRLGDDPLQLRKRTDPNPARQPLYAWASGLDAWANRGRIAADKGRYRRGVGVACATWFAFAEPKSRVRIDAGPDGVTVSTACQDMGNGTRTVLADTVARELGLPASHVRVEIGDSRFVPGPMSGGSRTTSSLVPATVDACDQLKDELLDVAQGHLGRGDLVATRAGVEYGSGRLSWLQVLEITEPITVVGRRRRDRGGYVLPPIQGLVVERYLTAAIQVVQVEVDTRLGRVRVPSTWGGFAVGRLVSPVLAHSQAKGGLLQAISYALYEERRLDPNQGLLLSAGLEDYRLIGIGDIPSQIHLHFHERGYDKVRERSVGLAELVTLAPPAALANAIHHATGWRPTDLPIRPDRVLAGVRG